jgi:Uma2 family endonuclease
MTSIILVPPPPKNHHPATKIKLTFDEYINYDDHTENRYELVRGNLLIMPTPSILHTNISRFLLYTLQNYLANLELSFVAINDVGVKTLDDTVRIPDLMICDVNIWENACKRKGAGVLYFDESPSLAIEITSQNWRDDYILKKAEYAMISIPEYWIIDPDKKQIRICFHWEDGEYKFKDYVMGETIESPFCTELNLTVEEIISPVIVENLIRQEKKVTKELQTTLEEEKQRADTEKQRADTEKQRADKLAILLRENGIDPNLL